MASLEIVDYIVIVIYLLAIVVVGVYISKKASSSIESYFLGSRELPFWALAASGIASNIDISGTSINAALIFVFGIQGFYIEFRGGVTLSLALFMIFGKWIRRSQVMTMAEWMELRFGKNRQGDVARIVSAISLLISTIIQTTYFAIGAGKFLKEFIDIPDFLGISSIFWGACILTGLAMIYTVTSGLQGVVWTDVIQGVLVFIAVLIVLFISWTHTSIPSSWITHIPPSFSKTTYYDTWINPLPLWKLNLPNSKIESSYEGFSYIGLVVLFYWSKALLEGLGGPSGYTAQRYFSVSSDEKSGKMGLLWIFLLSFRWPFIMSVVMLGITENETHPILDPEQVLPIVLNRYLPVFIKGFVISGLIAAGMSTFDSTINAGAAYYVKDIYQAYINKEATEKQLILHSRISSIIIVSLGLLLTFFTQTINEVWGFLNLTIIGGMLFPLTLRFFWEKITGYGFSSGLFGGILVGILQKIVWKDLADVWSFVIVVTCSFLVTMVVSLLTTQTDDDTLKHFYRVTKPPGFWKKTRELLDEEDNKILPKIDQENKRDLISAFLFSWVFQISLFLMWMFLVIGEILFFFGYLFLTCSTGMGLWYFWYRHLKEDNRLPGIIEKGEEIYTESDINDQDNENQEKEVVVLED